MPHIPDIKSAGKRAQLAVIRTRRNKIIKSSVKTAVRKFETAVTSGRLDDANLLLNKAVSTIDKAASKGTIHKNAANRKKAQLAGSLKNASAAQ